MAITSTTDITWRRGFDGSIDEEGASTYTRIFQLLSDTNTETVTNVLSALGVTLHSTPHPDDPFALARSINLSREEANRTVWYATVTYSSKSETTEEDPDDPLDISIKISWSSQIYQKFVWKDRDDNPITTVPGEFFKDTPTIDDVRWAIKIQQNLLSVPSWVLTYANKLNNATVSIDGVSFPEETLKVQSLTISEILQKNGVSYRQVNLELHYRESWKLEILHAGTMCIDNISPDVLAGTNSLNPRPILLPFRDESGNALNYADKKRYKTTVPIPLTEDGYPIENISTTTPNYRPFNVYETANFSVLPGVS